MTMGRRGVASAVSRRKSLSRDEMKRSPEELRAGVCFRHSCDLPCYSCEPRDWVSTEADAVGDLDFVPLAIGCNDENPDPECPIHNG